MAILKRANARGFKSKLREAVWPSMGWRRTFRYYRHRMFRAGDSTRRVVAGLATGAAVCWTPFFGTHMLLTLFLCWRLRLSAVAGLIGTAFGNPTTYPFMFVLGYKVGVIVCGWFGSDGLAGLPPGFAFRHLINHPLDFLEHHSLRLMLPLSVGGCLCALVFWPLAYVALYFPVNSARAAYRAQRLRHFRKKTSGGGAVIVGIGSDLIDIGRVEKVLARHGERFIRRCFTATEIAKAERRRGAGTHIATYAKRFAAKEACAKALGTGFSQGVFLRDIGVVNDAAGRPTLALTGGALARLGAITPEGRAVTLHLTITDEPPLAKALVIIEAVSK